MESEKELLDSFGVLKAEGFADTGDDCAQDEFKYAKLSSGWRWQALGLVKDESGNAGAG